MRVGGMLFPASYLREHRGGEEMGKTTGFQVMEARCDQCLFDADNRIVSRSRMAEVLRECRRRDAHFICHKATIDGGRNVCCRGFYDANPDATNLMRIAARLNAIQFVPVPAGGPNAD